MPSTQQLFASQAQLVGLIERSVINYNKLGKDKQTLATTQSRLKNLHDYWEKFQLQNSLIEVALTQDSELREQEYFTNSVFFKAVDFFDTACDYYNEIISQLSRSLTHDPAESFDRSVLNNEPCTSTRLPAINLPTFSGDLKEWETYRDLFVALVHTNPRLGDVQKLHYLKTSLIGEALLTLKHTSINAANYKPAWELINNRFDNLRAIVNAYLQAFVDIPNVKEISILHDLKKLRDQANDVRSALRNLKRPIEQWEDLYNFMIIKKLDARSLTDWELQLGAFTDMPTFDLLDQFLNTRIRVLESVEAQCSQEDSIKRQNTHVGKSNAKGCKVHQITTEIKNCVRCSGNHPLFLCNAFKREPVNKRKALVVQYRLCFNCLKKGHLVSNCESKNVCTICKGKHHTLLHADDRRNYASSSPNKDNPSGVSVNLCSKRRFSNSEFTVSCLPTAKVLVGSGNGGSMILRALLDQGSQVSCITERAVRELKLKQKDISINLTGVGQHQGERVRKLVAVSLSHVLSNQPGIEIHALVLPTLTSYSPPPTMGQIKWSHLQNLELADPNPQDGIPIDLIIGAGDFSRVILSGLRKGPGNSPMAQRTIFGWVVSGESPLMATIEDVSAVHHISTQTTLEEILRRFWEIEEVPTTSALTEDQIECERHFSSTHSRLSDGRYVVSLPFKSPPPPPIGDTYHIAKKLFFKTEQQLLKKPALYNEYKTFMREYSGMQHMILVPPSQTNYSGLFIPHMPVCREESRTTKVRVVFNASCRSSNGTSLNDFLHVGPKLQTDLSALVLRWRRHRFVYLADIAKMFRQILLENNDTCYQQILWRDSPSDPLSTYRLMTVTYGTASAPFLANRVLLQLAEDEGHKFPLAEPILRHNFYVDDVLFGSNDMTTIQQVRIQLQNLLMAGGFTLRKWASNCQALLADIPAEDHGLAIEKDFSVSDKLKVLGVSWNPTEDKFTFSCSEPTLSVLCKRTFLSVLAGIYDPLGWIAPFLVSGKIVMQLLWLRKISWDDPLPPDLAAQCSDFIRQLGQVSSIQLERWLQSDDVTTSVQIHGFGDASNLAYAASVYLRVEHPDGSVKVSLLCAKTKVAPLKTQSIPRLELCAAKLLCELVQFVKSILDLNSVPIFCWSDSQVVLYWINAHPSKWKCFVANRVSFIQTTLETAQWRYVTGGSNPADCASRGLSIEQLLSHQIWWKGPGWLVEPDSDWPQTKLTESLDVNVELRTVSVHTTKVDQQVWDLLLKFSSWSKLVRVTAYVIRFISVCLKIGTVNNSTSLTVREYSAAEVCLIKHSQRNVYAIEIKALTKGIFLPTSSSLLRLTPFLDKEGILRVGGRIDNSLLPDMQKHPFIIPKGEVAKLLTKYYHLYTLHGGTQVTLRVLREKYWIVAARSLVRSAVHQCVVCTRFRGKPCTQLMGKLPAFRLQPARPFAHVGVDYAGPLQVRLSAGRGRKSQKCYVAIFVCLTVRAVHIELVSDYTTSAFLAAFARFSARRGLPQHVYSDNGTTFQGANKELSRQFRKTISDEKVAHRMLLDEIKWSFIPPHAPHFGGIWEAGVKSVKHHLRRVVGHFTPTMEELQTLLCGIEAVLNSRPLTPLKDDPDSLEVLTPGHFLVGSLISTPPAPSLLDQNVNYLSRWQTIRTMLERFWRIWSSDYLNSLQLKTKWFKSVDNLQENDIVLIREPNLPPAKWLLGRICKVQPGQDGLVRVVCVRTANTTLKRPISQICKLPIET